VDDKLLFQSAIGNQEKDSIRRLRGLPQIGTLRKLADRKKRETFFGETLSAGQVGPLRPSSGILRFRGCSLLSDRVICGNLRNLRMTGFSFNRQSRIGNGHDRP